MKPFERLEFTQQKRIALYVFFGGIFLMIVHCLYYWPFLSDDSLISLRYSQRLLEGKGLTWNDDVRVEGYSNLLWVLLTSFLGKAGIDLIASVRILGLVCSIIILALPYLLFNKGIIKTIESVIVATAFLALAAPLAIWAIGGLEQPLVAALLALALIYLFPFENIHWGLPGIFFAGIAITRPDGILFAACACLSYLLIKGISWKTFVSCTKIMLLPMVLFLSQLLFRMYYYASLVPNTALVKISFSMQRLISGIKYVSAGYGSILPFTVLMIYFVFQFIRHRNQNQLYLFIIVTILVWSSYLVFIGGDIFPGERHFLPLFPLFALLIALGFDHYFTTTEKVLNLNSYTVAAIAFSVFIPLQFLFPMNARANEERWEWDGKAVATMLQKAWAKEQPLFGVTAAGCLPYWSGFPCIDMLGLNDYYIPRHPPATFGKGYLGHDLGNSAYVLSRKPDLISFCGPQGSIEPCFTADEQLTKEEIFQKFFHPCYFKTAGDLVTTSILWVSMKSPKIGIVSKEDSLFVPCWFMTDSVHFVTLGNAGKFVLSFQQGDTLSVPLADYQGSNLKITPKDQQLFKILDPEPLSVLRVNSAYVNDSYKPANKKIRVIALKKAIASGISFQ